ncbi:MAG: hypothetical protein FWE48_07415, partial [Coriobacteriia bacterium]|nr:hypothetical protein [Coriobacteriia bacterium]
KLTDQGYTTLLVVSETKPANVYGLPPGEYEVCEDTTGLASYISVSYASSVGSVRRSDATVELADRNSGSVVISNAYDDRTATLDISKETTGIAGDWDVDDSTVFAARLIDADNNALWAVFELGSSGEYTYAGIYDSRSGGSYELLAGFVEGNVTYDIEFSAEHAAKLKGIPVAPGKKYQIEELNPGNAYDVDVMLDGDDIRRAGVLAAFSDEFALSDTEHTEITFVNKYYGKEKMTIAIEKYLDGDYERFGIKASDSFKAELSLTEGSYQGLKLYFKLDADANYQLVGALDGITILELVWDGKAEKSEGSGLASWSLEEYTGELPEGWTTEIEFSKNKPAKLVGMVFGYYELEELYLTDFSYVVDYDGYGLPGDSFDPDGGGAELYENGLATRFTVINTWESRPVFLGNGILNITKTLAGNPGSWGVNNNTNFEARLQRAGTSRAIALVQDTTSLIPNSWIYVGEVVSAGNYADSTGAAIVIQDALAALSTELGVTLTTADIKTSFSISRAQGATIRGLEAVSYRVIETNNTVLGTYTISYNPSGGTVTMADNSLSVGVTNTFSTKPGPPTPPPAPKPPTPPPPAPKPVPKPPLPKKEVKVPVVKRSTAKPTPKPPVQESRRMPRTGDFVNMGLWILLIGAAGTAGAVALKKKSKKEVDETDLGSQDE